MKVGMIAAVVEKCDSIGDGVQMPWEILAQEQGKTERPLQADMERFKLIRQGKALIMGRGTFESFRGRLLKDAMHIVVTSNPGKGIANQLLYCTTLKEAIKKAEMLQFDEVLIIGGAKMYEEGMKHADTLYMTWVSGEFNLPVKFPIIDPVWEPVETSACQTCEVCGLHFFFETLEKNVNSDLYNG